MNNRVYVYLAT